LAATEPRLLPRIELSGYSGTEARSLDDFLGQPLLVEFFAQWCEPCSREVPHLNKLAADFGPKGLNILAVTGDDADTAKTWLARFDAKYPYALDAKLELQIELGFQPLPFAVLVDPTGVIVWEGNPAKLEPATVDAATRDQMTRAAFRWPEDAAPVRAALRRNRFDEARRLAESVHSFASELTSFVDRSIERRRHLMQAAYDRGDFLTADDLAGQLISGLDGGVAKSRATEMRDRIAKDEAATRIQAALTQVRKLWGGVAGLESKKAADELAEKLRALAKDHAGTIVETRVEAHVRTLTAFKALLQR
jgi:thiol-disulfide isomerase/thioredoxin